MKIGIIGGGASGMILASKIKNHDVTIFERNNKLGKKLLLTGNGKCNYTNLNFADLNSIYNNEFAIGLYKKYDNISLINYFKELGIVSKVETHKGIDYVYPNSNKSTSVYYCLMDKILYNRVNILYDSFVKDIKHNNKYYVYTEDKCYEFDALVLSTGGSSYKKTGSDGSGYTLANKLGHSITNISPGLTSFKYCFKNDNNDNIVLKDKCRVNARVSFKYNDKTFSESGEIQLNEDSISGIPVLNLSSEIARLNIDYDKVALSLDLVSHLKDTINVCDDIKSLLVDRKNKTNYRKIDDFLCGFLPDEISEVILKLSGVYKKDIKDINDKDIDAIATNISNLKIYVKGKPNIDEAQVTVGGIDIKEVYSDTLESKIHKGLYFTGEILDIDGKCGGYNLQLAYSTASIVAENIA